MADPVVLPPSRSDVPVWLSPADVKAWLRLNAQDTTDDDLVQAVCAMAEPYVERCRPEFFIPDPAALTAGGDPSPPNPARGGTFPRAGDGVSYQPDAETYRGGVMYAAREYRRRNSPAGIEVFGDVASFVTRYDTDIERALQTGAYAPPVIA